MSLIGECIFVLDATMSIIKRNLLARPNLLVPTLRYLLLLFFIFGYAKILLGAFGPIFLLGSNGQYAQILIMG